jgi:hypothetical protein
MQGLLLLSELLQYLGSIILSNRRKRQWQWQWRHARLRQLLEAACKLRPERLLGIPKLLSDRPIPLCTKHTPAHTHTPFRFNIATSRVSRACLGNPVMPFDNEMDGVAMNVVQWMSFPRTAPRRGGTYQAASGASPAAPTTRARGLSPHPPRISTAHPVRNTSLF